MSLKLNERYPGRFSNPTAAYPQGSFKNRTAPGALDGTYLEKDWANDQLAFLSSLLDAAGIAPNGNVDQVGASHYSSFATRNKGGSLQSSCRYDWSQCDSSDYGRRVHCSERH
jgi:hypothetical protein